MRARPPARPSDRRRTIARLNGDIRDLESQEGRYTGTWEARKVAFDEIVRALEEMGERVREEQNEQERRRALDDDAPEAEAGAVETEPAAAPSTPGAQPSTPTSARLDPTAATFRPSGIAKAAAEELEEGEQEDDRPQGGDVVMEDGEVD